MSHSFFCLFAAVGRNPGSGPVYAAYPGGVAGQRLDRCSQRHCRSGGHGSAALSPGGNSGGGVQLCRSVLRDGGKRLGGRDGLLHRRLFRRPTGGLHCSERRNGRGSDLGSGVLAVGYPYQREPRLSGGDHRGGGGPGGKLELCALGELGESAAGPPAVHRSRILVWAADGTVGRNMEGIGPPLLLPSASRSGGHRLFPRSAGRARSFWGCFCWGRLWSRDGRTSRPL